MTYQAIAALASANKPSDNAMKYLIFAGLGIFFWVQFKDKINLWISKVKLSDQQIVNVGNTGVASGNTIDGRWVKAQSLADQIFAACNGVGTDTVTLSLIYKVLVNDIPLLRLVNTAYGVRQVRLGFGGSDLNLAATLADELSGDAKLNWVKLCSRI